MDFHRLRSNVYLLTAAMILTGALAVAAAQKQVPFKGSMQGNETDTHEGGPPPTTLSVDGVPQELLPMSANSHSPINSR